MSVLSDPAYIVHNLRLSNLRLDDRTSDKVITFPPMLLSNDYIKTAGPVFPEMQFCYSPNISHDYMMVANNSLLLGSSDACLTAEDSVGPKVKSTMGVRGKYDRRRIVAAQAAAAAAAAGLGRGGIEGSSVFPMQPAPVPAMRVPVSMAVASMESDDDIDLDDEEPVKSPPRMFPKMAIPAYIGANFAPGIFITTPSRPGSATIPEDPNSQLKSQQTSENTENTGAGTGTEVSKEGDSDQTRAQEQEAGDITIDSIASPIDLSPPDLTIAPIAQRQPSEMSDGLASPNTLVSPSPVRPNTPPPKPISTPVNGLLSEPIPLERPAPVSLLTSLIIKQKSRDDNPFAEEFLRVAGMGETTPVQLKIYLPHSDKPKDPMQVVVKREASVEDVIGYILYQYYHEGRTPHFTDDQSTVVQWNLRIVEDDGEIDDDLPVPVAPRPDPLVASTQHYVRVRLHTNHEVKHTTTVEILPKMLVSEVVDYICLKRKMNPAEWALVVADTHHVLPLDGAAEDISNSTELALVPKSTVESILAAKRIKFGRNGAMTDIPGSGVSYLTSTEVYREYTLNRKRRGGYVGHHEQVLAIDGDYVRIMPTSTRTMLFDSGKTASYLKNTIYDCRRSRKAPSSFKLIVIRGDREKKTYEFEASSPQESRK
ncbi:hypothetical protein BGZ59_005627 [Podila verticillata]|nr:hypothetical protein BGZ59_005627 [Podila verticillata]